MPKTPKDPPLVDVKVTNPITYFKNWWAKVIGNEGVEFGFKIRPLTAIVIAAVIATIGFGVGRFVFPYKLPFFEYGATGKPAPSQTPEVWKETAFIGTLKYSFITRKYFLVTSTSSEAISLSVPENLNLEALVEKRVFAEGSYNKATRTLIVSDAKDMEVLPKNPVPIPTITPIPSPTSSSFPEPVPTQIPPSQ